MYFKKLEIFGFKSFADKTVLNFEEGVTAVVGPNGCGKSNIFDSIRWVLGEQSIKQLRGSSKEDVIFNGTDKRGPLGFAEVSLTFANENRALPIEYDEVMITRRLFRSGDSEYLLNKVKVRLKDIQELLMGTGIGSEAYSLIQQGKVDKVVSAKPDDRRQIFDEAAGITKYKAKKREALNKLKDTDNNLLRINDITTEVKRQIASVERQANKARKYKDEFEKLKDLEVKIARHEMGSFTERKDKIQEEIDGLIEKDENITKEVEELNTLLTNEINYLGELEEKIGVVHTEEAKFDGEIDLDNRQIGYNDERIENLDTNEGKWSEQKQQLKEKCSLQQEKIEELKTSISSLEGTLGSNDQILLDRKESILSLERHIEEAKEKIRNNEEKLLELTSGQVSIRNDLTDTMKLLQGAIARKRRLDIEHGKVKKENQQIDQKLQNTEFQILTAHGVIEGFKVSKEQESKKLEEFRTSHIALEKEIKEEDKKKMFLISQRDFIEKLNTQYDDIPDPVTQGKFITEVPPDDHHTGIVGKVVSVGKSQEGRKRSFWKRLVGGASTHGEKNLYEIICETKFIELDPQQITSEIEVISKKIEELNAHKDEITLRMKKQIAKIAEIDEKIVEKEKSYSVLLAQKSDILEEVKKLNSELEVLESELAEAQETVDVQKKKEEELNYKLDTVNQDIAWSQNDIKDKREWIAQKSKEREELNVSVAQLVTEIQSEIDRLASQKENVQMFAETLDGWLEEIKKIDDEILGQEPKRQEYSQENENLKGKISGVKQEKDSLRGVISEYEIQKNDVGQRINSVRASVTSLEDQIIKIKQLVHEKKLTEQEVSFSEKSIKERLEQAYKVDLNDDVTSEEGQDLENVETFIFDYQEAKDEKLRLKKRCDSFGNVNLAAMDEYEEMKERFEFLTKQQSDLLEAKSQLMSTITKINRSTRQLFLDTFTKVSEEFRIYFRMLFGGGEANLTLLDTEHVLESGIDIVARPPGKKLQNISLLSGGEKTLTAIALIFAVFKVNPSPFCVLDEIDAALDESNVGRFAYLLKDFSKIAQFIVITHNKKTIANADVMYGITMPETGCSRIVSVKFKEDQKAQEKVAAGV
jgi:chromosome segregation protein